MSVICVQDTQQYTIHPTVAGRKFETSPTQTAPQLLFIDKDFTSRFEFYIA